MTAIGTSIGMTPWWVWVILAGLVAEGWRQSHPRRVSLRSLWIWPALLMPLSLLSVLNSFGIAVVPVLAWLAGLLVMLTSWPLLHAMVRRSGAAGMVDLGGSWVPMVALLGMFAVRYAVGYGQARQLPWVQTSLFVAVASSVMALVAGWFAARAIAALRAPRSQTVAS